MHTKVWLENQMGKDNLADLGVDGRIFKKQGLRMSPGFIWLRMKTCGRLL
jgi:hypothetical protein